MRSDLGLSDFGNLLIGLHMGLLQKVRYMYLGLRIVERKTCKNILEVLKLLIKMERRQKTGLYTFAIIYVCTGRKYFDLVAAMRLVSTEHVTYLKCHQS